MAIRISSDTAWHGLHWAPLPVIDATKVGNGQPSRNFPCPAFQLLPANFLEGRHRAPFPLSLKFAMSIPQIRLLHAQQKAQSRQPICCRKKPLQPEDSPHCASAGLVSR